MAISALNKKLKKFCLLSTATATVSSLIAQISSIRVQIQLNAKPRPVRPIIESGSAPAGAESEQIIREQ